MSNANNTLTIAYSIGVFTPAGWRQVRVTAKARQVSAGMAEVVEVLTIHGETPAKTQSRTGAKRQQFNGVYAANAEAGKKKRLSTCDIIATETAAA